MASSSKPSVHKRPHTTYSKMFRGVFEYDYTYNFQHRETSFDGMDHTIAIVGHQNFSVVCPPSSHHQAVFRNILKPGKPQKGLAFFKISIGRLHSFGLLSRVRTQESIVLDSRGMREFLKRMPRTSTDDYGRIVTPADDWHGVASITRPSAHSTYTCSQRLSLGTLLEEYTDSGVDLVYHVLPPLYTPEGCAAHMDAMFRLRLAYRIQVPIEGRPTSADDTIHETRIELPAPLVDALYREKDVLVQACEQLERHLDWTEEPDTREAHGNDDDDDSDEVEFVSDTGRIGDNDVQMAAPASGGPQEDKRLDRSRAQDIADLNS